MPKFVVAAANDSGQRKNIFHGFITQ